MQNSMRLTSLPHTHRTLGSVRIEIKPVNPDGSEDDLTDEDLEEDAEAYREENWPTRKDTREFKPLMDPEVVRDFLLGNEKKIKFN